jgi:hypothetical protein
MECLVAPSSRACVVISSYHVCECTEQKKRVHVSVACGWFSLLYFSLLWLYFGCCCRILLDALRHWGPL